MAVSLNAITLPDDAIWTDEWEWTPIEQAVSRTLGGRQIIEAASKIGGRPITLQAQWVDKAVVDALIVERDIINNQMLLTIADGRQFTVSWRHSDNPLDVSPAIEYPEYQAGDKFDITLKLFEV